MKNKVKWSGVFLVVFILFKDDYLIDEEGFCFLVCWVVSYEGVNGIVVNGYMGEIMILLFEECVEVVRIVVDELKGCIFVISGVLVEGIIEVI